MKRTILTSAAVVAALFFVASAANADDFYLVCCDFDDPNCWQNACDGGSPIGNTPGANDHVVVCSELSCNVDENVAWGTVDVQTGAVLNIQAAKTLSLSNAGGQFSTINGTINLVGSGSTLSFTSSHIVVGGGSIDGGNDSAVIAIASGETLTNMVEIEGNCQIMSAGRSGTTFTNNGIVHANTAGTLYVAPDLIGVSSGIWQVSTNANAVLQIGAVSAGAHTGSVNVSNGTLDIDYDFETEGQLTLTNGTIDVASTKTFEAS